VQVIFGYFIKKILTYCTFNFTDRNLYWLLSL